MATMELFQSFVDLLLARPDLVLQVMSAMRCEKELKHKRRVMKRVFAVLAAIGVKHSTHWKVGSIRS